MHPEVRDVLISGGDPLLLKDNLLEYIQMKNIKLLEVPWERFVSHNTNMTINLLYKYPYLKKWRKSFSQNPNVNIKLVTQRPIWFWDWNHLSSNPSISAIDVMTHLDLPWNFPRVSKHKFKSE